MRLFTFNSIDLSAVPAISLVFSEGFTEQEENALRAFEQDFHKYVNVMEIHNYETAEQLMPAFEDFLERNGMVESNDDDEVNVLAMITSVTQILIGSKATLLIELTKTSEQETEDGEDDFEAEDDEDDFGV
jgi:hypothetical protein